MKKKRLVLRFPPDLVEEPITYRLIRDYDLMVNILQATVTPREEGRLVVEISGEKEALEKGLGYLSEIGVRMQPLARDVLWHQDKCTHCTACVPLCPAVAFILDREKHLISFQKDKCIACGLCIRTCPYRAIEILF